ncbi:bifunctional 2',3'-cyclic-nucleotide 2'-phosphodiesterase/3'-nucleotidase [Paracoccus sp. TK19116]|uniref:Bifunctional 2',3'-cyclic-nucleotide 2'-phosphodiesterase/3'-nucleotidase n=1 Tax=Paracoccus albicereus TaxID=2922394 RepID=A0ABT1MNG8_9RHOB|nr:bifunctional 2',3'-cyclic-nucleotide 2'-phosphodiesterase/3'-nucleotidase [Paracoccus albicereus]MCQ0969839.1 bifunctional 2',3'-cyclic-nucleotide 2'-phosphodiesterase/3'-nucleotidase [Paracoccus albicereus]
MADGNCGLDYQDEAEAASRFALRILATTDLHMHVLPFDYLADRPNPGIGLARTASLIACRGRNHPNTLLFDNGDFLQGSPLGDFVAYVDGVGPRKPHPAIAAMNAMGYDAATLGNHDFSYGVGFLMRAIEGARFPFTLANVCLSRHRAPPRSLILDREIEALDGSRQTLRIGVIGLVPPQTVEWDRQLHRDMACADIVEAAAAEVPLIRAAGADLVVALAHTGIGEAEATPGMENAATALAALPGIDAVITGHTHQVFPDPLFPATPGVDPTRGALAGKPAVMAGFGGSHLGVIDLDLRRDAFGRWTIEGFSSRAEPVGPDIPAAAVISDAAKRHHAATRRHLRRRIARSRSAMTSFFSLIGDDPGLHLVAKAQRWHVRRALRDTEWAKLPILSASAPFRAGGRGGPDHYTCVAAGRLTERNLADLYLFPNRICAVEMRGADLIAWLERSASIFRRITPGQTDAPLIDDAFPSYNFDVIDGLTWEIDLSQPPPCRFWRVDRRGQPSHRQCAPPRRPNRG